MKIYMPYIEPEIQVTAVVLRDVCMHLEVNISLCYCDSLSQIFELHSILLLIFPK